MAIDSWSGWFIIISIKGIGGALRYLGPVIVASRVHLTAQSLVEPFATPEIYACGLGAVHIIGGGACCLVWYRNSAVVEAPGTMCRRVTGSVIIPVGSIPEAMQQLIAATTDEAVAALNVLKFR